MKKRFISIILGVAVVTVATWNILGNEVTLSDLALENTEALAAGEVVGGGGEGSKSKCYNTITTKEGCLVKYCQTCSYVSGTYTWTSGTGSC